MIFDRRDEENPLAKSKLQFEKFLKLAEAGLQNRPEPISAV